MKRVEHGHTRGVERGEARRQAAVTDVPHDRVEQIDHSTDRGGDRVGGEGDVLLPGVAIHAFPGHCVVVVVDERLHEQLVAEDAAVEHFVALVRRHDVLVAPGTGACLELRLQHDELRRSNVELLGRGLDADARDLDVTVRARELVGGDLSHVGHARQVRR
jgi:hypothetical protein